MKTIFLIILVIISHPNLFSQNPGPSGEYCIDNIPIDCSENILYPFIFCCCDGNNHGKIIHICMNNPYGNIPNRFASFCSNLKPLKINMPICAVFDDSGPVSAKDHRCDLPDDEGYCRNIIVYEKKDFISELNSTLSRINCLCGYTPTDDCGCTISVKFSDNRKNFNKVHKEVVTSLQLHFKEDMINNGNYFDENCNVQCDNITIYLNENLGNDVQHGRTSFYAMDSYYNDVEHNLNQYGDGHTVSPNLKDVLTYALGQIMGVGFDWQSFKTYGNEGYTNEYYTTEDLSCMHLGDNHNSYFSSNDFSHNKSPERLPIADQCMFTKLYCWDLVEVIDEEKSTKTDELRNYPNPFNGITVIPFTVKNNNSSVKILVFNNFGKKIKLLKEGKFSIGKHQIEFDGSDYPSGIYYCVVLINNIYYSKKIVILK